MNASMLFHHDFRSNLTKCIISTNKYRESDLSNIFLELATHSSKPPSPFVIIALFAEYASTEFENERKHLDTDVCLAEAQSGVTVHNIGAGRAKVTEYASVKKELHIIESLLSMQEHILAYQAKLAEFLVEMHSRFSKIQRVEIYRKKGKKGNGDVDVLQDDHLHGELALNASMAKWRVEQSRVLIKRINIQLEVVNLSSSIYRMRSSRRNIFLTALNRLNHQSPPTTHSTVSASLRTLAATP